MKCGFKLEWVEKPTVDKLLAGGPNPKGPVGRLGPWFSGWFRLENGERVILLSLQL